MSLNRPTRVLIWSILLLLAMRCVASAVVPLMHQEAYYWMYAQHPSLSYYDHPPMVAWVIGLGTKIFGNTEWGVRVVGGLLMLLNGWLIYEFARGWWGKTVGLMTVALFELSPVYFGIGFLATMDAPLLTFWLLGLVGFTLAVKSGKAWGWYLCGAGLGGALLSKYTGVYLIPGVGLLLLFHKPWRKYLISPHPYLAVMLGFSMFSPVLIWNSEHDWASFRFQFLDRFDSGTSHKHPMIEFFGQQVAVVTPVVLGGFFLVGYRAIKRRRLSGRDKMALAFTLPLLASVMNKAWGYPIHINWTAPAYLSFIPCAIQAARVRVRAGVARPVWLWRGGVVMPTLLACAAINLGLMLFLVFIEPRAQSFRMFGPWDQLARQIEFYEDNLQARTGREPLVIVDGKYELASLMAFYRNRVDPGDLPSKMTVNQLALGDTALGYAYWNDMKNWRGSDCVFVDDNADPTPRLNGVFKSVKVVWSGKTSKNGKTYSISECHDYLGAPSSVAAAR
ncbi:MAG: dolichyl-phosphate-mannose--protein mannosyltransferase [Phycisphaerales bacterium]|nr:dolichyl-phosphate-mannose--protein mannosyltransferase [Phycisphaerales bacterium]